MFIIPLLVAIGWTGFFIGFASGKLKPTRRMSALMALFLAIYALLGVTN